METQKDFIEESKQAYKDNLYKMPRDYAKIARTADIATEECLRQMSHGSDGVFKNQMYPLLFMKIFEELIK